MNEILNWNEAEERLNQCLSHYMNKKCSSYNYKKKIIADSKTRFDKKERTIDLYNQIMGIFI